MKQCKASCGNFVIATREIESVVKGSVGLVKNLISSGGLTAYFVGSNKMLKVKESDIALLDIKKTGKGLGTRFAIFVIY